MQGLILAAGMGSRLKKLTENNTKSMVAVNGVSLIERMLKILDEKNLSKIIVVTGYKSEFFTKYINSLELKTKIEFINNDIYDTTNNIYSMYLAKDFMEQDDTITLESDLIFDSELIDELIDDARENLALVSKYERWMDGTCFKLNENEEILEFISGKEFNFEKADEYFKTINIYKFSKEFSKLVYFPFLEAYIKANGMNDYYESVLKLIIGMKKNHIQAKVISDNIKWYEIDDEQDLDIAESIFSSGSDKLNKYQIRYGGYWRYPKLLDFCYLVNPYFPPKKLKEELKYNFNTLLEQYPSGLTVNSNLCAKIFGVNKEHIVVGNGAAELIKSVIENFNGNIGVIRPTFEEYPNRYDKSKTIIYVPNNEDFRYDAKDLIEFYSDKNIEALVLINPDNPTGNYIEKKEVLKLLNWAKTKKITFILDESFVDFSDEENSSFIFDEYLDIYERFIVIKSISKSYGVPGLRLGILATSNKEMISYIKKDVSIWNINSFGEYYLQIYEKYKKDYKFALDKIKESRKNFVSKLEEISEFRIIPSQANYLTLEVLKGTSEELCIRMLEKNIFIKDLTSKIKLNGRQFIRVAVRDEIDNSIFIDEIKKYFK
ncbi:MAG: aminotransferase class I/II-fold pyridoxal phosphate-dependent enzyme [Peptoniphilaceae bacterium]|uniref:aminotransferase class I/II-fold pyridoxal phosphate-dependent enzyme n=1 Tax=Parvimonas sp. TaxID=1944660 RepID=UPI0025FEA710|nr:aminotransferase class I/II-fold pyridoxal phosphate-dependent enzyme [Parvimonas sp.]MCI5997780.1 aminotransferase class I/II-fold pyridoxal phosphate-dependent enzyme [Parvimonas sp.]MDD7765295.1 aminotransferase class I/II-fold pyridoxal phosphate-dependent enzyme [Peptoniphilaceae bacterium]